MTKKKKVCEGPRNRVYHADESKCNMCDKEPFPGEGTPHIIFDADKRKELLWVSHDGTATVCELPMFFCSAECLLRYFGLYSRLK